MEVRLDLLKLLVGLETLVYLTVVQFNLDVCLLSLLHWLIVQPEEDNLVWLLFVLVLVLNYRLSATVHL